MIDTLIQSGRLARAGLVLARHGALDMALPDELPAPARAGIAILRALFGRRRRKAGDGAEERLAAAITALGPSYIKLGQFLATRPDLVGQPRARALSRLQDRLPPFSQAEAKKALHDAFGAEVETLAQSVAIEMDLRMEAAAMSEMAENAASDEGFRIPAVDWSRSARRVLTTDWIDGTPLGDLDALDAAGHDRERLARIVIQTFLRHAMRDGFFHADMHPGNLFVDAQGDLVAVDFGIMGRIGPKEQRFLAEILWGFIRRDYRRVAEVHIEAGYVPARHGAAAFAQAIRAIGEPLMGRTAEEISMARVLTQLFQVTELFDMETRPELLLLQKTMVVVEGVGRMLDPDLDMWATAEPVVAEWVEANLGPQGRVQDAADGAASLGRFVSHVPGLLARAESTAEILGEMARGGLRLDDDTIEHIARARARRDRSGRLAIWIGALALAVIALNLVF